MSGTVTSIDEATSARTRRPSPVFESGRRCTHVGANGERCITILCRVNPGPECFAHTGRRREHPDPQILVRDDAA